MHKYFVVKMPSSCNPAYCHYCSKACSMKPNTPLSRAVEVTPIAKSDICADGDQLVVDGSPVQIWAEIPKETEK